MHALLSLRGGLLRRTAAVSQFARQTAAAYFGTSSSSVVMKDLLTTDGLSDMLEGKRGAGKKPWLLDCSWLSLPVFEGRNALEEFAKLRLPGARFFDIDVCCDTTSPFPHMLPSREALYRYMMKLLELEEGKPWDQEFVVYDSLGGFSSPRVWWMLRTFGYRRVAVLDGGLAKWHHEGRQIESGNFSELPSVDVDEKADVPEDLPEVDSEVVFDYSTINRCLAHLEEPDAWRVVDARSASRFQGLAPEPREGLPSGHMPGSLNVPWDSVLVPNRYKRHNSLLSGKAAEGGSREVEYDYFTFKSPTALASYFLQVGIEPNVPVVSTCGSGVSGSTVLFALHLADPSRRTALYDGSWVEWKTRRIPEEEAERMKLKCTTEAK